MPFIQSSHLCTWHCSDWFNNIMSQLRKDLFSCGMDQPILTKSPHHMLCGSTQTHTARPSRLVTRRGFTNIRSVNITNKKERFLADYFTTLLEAKWHWIFLLFCSAFLGSWASFGTIWWLIAWSRTFTGSEAICIENVDSWTSAFLFSVETQTTIGYGGRQVGTTCTCLFSFNIHPQLLVAFVTYTPLTLDSLEPTVSWIPTKPGQHNWK